VFQPWFIVILQLYCKYSSCIDSFCTVLCISCLTFLQYETCGLLNGCRMSGTHSSAAKVSVFLGCGNVSSGV
jgi:hypothetical protein